MKKKLALILAAAMTVSAMSMTAVAEEEYPEVNVVINGEELESDQPAVIIDSRTMVPMRAIAEALDVEVDWVADTKTVVFAKDDVTAELTIGETVLNVTAAGVTVPVEIDAPAVIVNSRTLVPVRFISENFGAEVEWDGDTKTVTITSAVVEDDTTSDSAVDVEEEATEAEDTEETADEETEATEATDETEAATDETEAEEETEAEDTDSEKAEDAEDTEDTEETADEDAETADDAEAEDAE